MGGKMSLALPRSASELSLARTQSMEVAEEAPRSLNGFWEVGGLCTLLVSYLPPEEIEAVASYCLPQKSFTIFQKAVAAHEYTEPSGIAYVKKRLYKAKENPSLVSIITTHFLSLRILNFCTFPVPAMAVLQLAKNPRTALILAHSINFLAAIDGENVRNILANKMLATLRDEKGEEVQKVRARREQLIQGQQKLYGKRKREEAVLGRSRSEGYPSKRSRYTDSPAFNETSSSQ